MKIRFLLSAALTVAIFASCGPKDGVKAGWIDINDRYLPGACPETFAEEGFPAPVWKNDRANAEVFVWSENEILPKVSVSVTDLKTATERLSKLY